jgi:hypothetical protein
MRTTRPQLAIKFYVSLWTSFGNVPPPRKRPSTERRSLFYRSSACLKLSLPQVELNRVTQTPPTPADMLIARDRLPPFLNGRVGQADKGPNAQRLPSKKTARMGDRAKLSASLGRRLCCLNFSLFVLPVTSRKSELQSDGCAPGIKRPKSSPQWAAEGRNLGLDGRLGPSGPLFCAPQRWRIRY